MKLIIIGYIGSSPYRLQPTAFASIIPVSVTIAPARAGNLYKYLRESRMTASFDKCGTGLVCSMSGVRNEKNYRFSVLKQLKGLKIETD